MMTATTLQIFTRFERYPGKEQAVTVNNRTHIQKHVLIHIVITHKEN